MSIASNRRQSPINILKLLVVPRGNAYVANKIMIPTDGSDPSTAAALEGIAFAADNKSEVIGVYVAPEYQYPVYVEIIPPTYPIEEEYDALMRKVGMGSLPADERSR